MKKYFFFFLLSGFLCVRSADAFDLKGIQPIAPYGIFSTFSAESLKQGSSAVALGVEKSWRPDFYRFTAQVGYGITDSMELGITVPYDSEWRDTLNGFEDVAIAFKHRFFDEGKYGPSVAYILSASLPTGKDEFSTEGSYGAGIIFSKKVGPVNAHANLFYSRPGTKRFTDDVTFAGGIDFSASHNFKILGEIYGKKSYSGKVDRLEARFGYRIVTAENLYTTLGVGYDLKNRSPEYRLLFSLTYLFTGEKKSIKRIYEEE